MYVTGTEGQHYVTGFDLVEENRHDFLFTGAQGNRTVTVLLYSIIDSTAVYARYGFFAGGIDGGDDQQIRLIKGDDELFIRVPCPGIPMRLEHNYQPSVRPALRVAAISVGW